MKSTAVVALVASLGAASAFAPSSFNGAAVTSRTSVSSGTQMFFGPKKKAAAPAPAKPAAPAKKAAPAPKKAAPVKKSITLAKPTPVAAVASDVPVDFGGDIELKGAWDPARLATGKDADTLAWYRASELKHGRVAMLAALGTLINALGIALPDATFEGTTKSFDALAQVAEQRPGAIIQIVLGIGAIEALTLNFPEGQFGPGDLGFDPANQIPVFEKQGKFDELRLKELKNGRLAMVSIIGMWVQEALTGQGLLEQLAAGHISPVGDGQGYF